MRNAIGTARTSRRSFNALALLITQRCGDRDFAVTNPASQLISFWEAGSAPLPSPGTPTI